MQCYIILLVPEYFVIWVIEKIDRYPHLIISRCPLKITTQHSFGNLTPGSFEIQICYNLRIGTPL